MIEYRTITARLFRIAARVAVAGFLGFSVPAAANDSAGGGIPEIYQTFVKDGIAIEYSVRSLAGRKVHGLLAGDEAELSFRLTDAATGDPIRGLYPSAWLDSTKGEEGREDEITCKAKVQSFLQGSLAFRPEIDLNAWYILTLNEDASLSVIDPLVGYNGERLLASVNLKGPGADWALSPNMDRLFVTVPAEGRVSVIDTQTWTLERDIDVGPNPVNIALQPDGKYIWVTVDGDGSRSGGVTVIDPKTLAIAGQIKTGAGHHEIAFSDDDRSAFVSNEADGTVTVIDVEILEFVKTIKTGLRPVSMSFSALGNALYVANKGAGTVTVIDGETHEVLDTIASKPGIETIRFSPDGRWGFLLNPAGDTVDVLDTSTNRVVHTIHMGPGPDQVTFSLAYAYIRSSGTPEIGMVPLDALGKPGGLSVANINGGRIAPGAMPFMGAADAIIPTPEGDSVLLASPKDKTIFHYMEGMNAPSGNIGNFLREPRAIMVFDRSLQETGPGVYSTIVTLPEWGSYDTAFMLDSPLLINCFETVVAANPDNKPTGPGKVRVEYLMDDLIVTAGETETLRFRLVDEATGEPRADIKDMRVMTMLVPGIWHNRLWAEPVGDGVYEAAMPLPDVGIYYVYIASDELGRKFHEFPFLTLHSQDGQVAGDGSGS